VFARPPRAPQAPVGRRAEAQFAQRSGEAARSAAEGGGTQGRLKKAILECVILHHTSFRCLGN